MDALEKIMIDVPAQPRTEIEKRHIDIDKEYFGVTPYHFIVYSKQKRCWYCLRTKAVIPGNISDVINEQGEMLLFIQNKPVISGKWGTANSIDAILDLFNSGRYLELLSPPS